MVSTIDETSPPSGSISVGVWAVHPASNRIESDGRSVHIEPKAMAVLQLLAERSGETVSRQELLDHAWPGVVVSDDALTQVIIKLRKALGDDSRNPEYIQTIPKRGYLLLAPVGTPPDAGPGIRGRKIPPAALGLIGLLLVLGSYLLFISIDGGSKDHPASVTAGGESAEPLSIAVLPFENLDAQPGPYNFARAITADLTTDLSKLSKLWVISAPLGREAPVPARYLVTGSIRHTAERLNLYVRLLEAQSRHQIWSERYDRPVGDLFEVQHAVSHEVVKQLAIQVTAAERQRLAHRYTLNLAAYEDFLRGQEALLLRQQQANRSARHWYRQAIEKDPNFARAYAGMALSYAADYRNQWVDDGETALQHAVNMAETAQQIDPDIPEVYWVLGYVNAQKRRLDEALQYLARAIELDHSFADAYALMGGIHTYKGEPAKTLPLLREAMRLQPDAGYLYYLLLGRAYFFVGDYEQAKINLREALSRNAQALEARIYLAAAEAGSRDVDAAAWETQELLTLKPDFDLTEWLTTYPMIDASQRKKLADALAPVGL